MPFERCARTGAPSARGALGAGVAAGVSGDAFIGSSDIVFPFSQILASSTPDPIGAFSVKAEPAPVNWPPFVRRRVEPAAEEPALLPSCAGGGWRGALDDGRVSVGVQISSRRTV